MAVKAGQFYARKEPRGDHWDKVRIVGPSPLGQDEVLVAPVDAFVEDDGPAVVSESATPESVLEVYVLDGDAAQASTVLGENALGAWNA